MKEERCPECGTILEKVEESGEWYCAECDCYFEQDELDILN